ncbi:MAG: 2-hydroxyacyl-CoA dehydratase family protein [Pseudomonadota bacterium]
MDIDDTAEIPPIPLPDLKVVEEMQMSIAMRLADIQRMKAEGKPVVWSSVLIPKEILYGMDVAVLYSSVLGAYAAIFGLSAKYCQAAEDEGLSRDTCSVNRCAIGVACCDDKDDFFETAYTRPDLVIGSNFPCTAEARTFLHIAKKYDLPYYFIDAPINTWGKEIPEYAVRYYADQLQGLIDFLTEHGYSFDMDRLKREVAFTKELNTLMDEIDEYKRAIPLPIKAYDTVIAMTAPLALSQEARKIELFKRLRDEVKERVDRKIGVVEDEKLRLMWVGLPPLNDFKLLNYTEKHGAVMVKHMLEFLVGFSLDPDLMDPEKPLESIARAQLSSPANPMYQASIDYFVKAVKDYKVDGVICVIMRSCGHVPGMQRMTKEEIFKETGVPALIFDLDGSDAREYDEAATKAHLDSFVETLLARKGG